jgi:hypothetical protein
MTVAKGTVGASGAVIIDRIGEIVSRPSISVVAVVEQQGA